MEARTWVCIGAALLLLISAYLYWRTIWFFRNPSTWILKKIGCPESFSEPLLLYQLALERGLTHVTITDHNQLAGSLDIAHLPNAFISEQEEFMAIHTATPGPVGLAALLIARILKLPCYSTYHTSIPQYARHLTEDPDIEELAWKYICWYYDQMDRVYVPSQSTRQELIGKGLAAAYASAELFIFPSTTDTFGNVILEAQASGLPVIVTNQGGPQENILPGETGVIVPANDPQALDEAVENLIADPLRLKRMGQAARQFLEDRSFEKAFQETWEMYRHPLHPDESVLAEAG